MPETITVTFSLQNGTECETCSTLNGPHQLHLDTRSGPACVWHKHYASPEDWVCEVLVAKWGDHYVMQVWLHVTAWFCELPHNTYWYKTQDTPFNCAALNVNVPLDYDETPWGCTGTAVVTS